MNLRIEQDGRLRRIALAAVEKRNLLDASMCHELLHELRDAVADDAVGAILLEADGPVFCSGVDSVAGEELFTIGRRMVKPLVAAVQGVAVSGGVALLANAHVHDIHTVFLAFRCHHRSLPIILPCLIHDVPS